MKPFVLVGEAFAWVPPNPDISDKLFSVPSYPANTITPGHIGLKILDAPCINRSTNQQSLVNFNFNQIYAFLAIEPWRVFFTGVNPPNREA